MPASSVVDAPADSGLDSELVTELRSAVMRLRRRLMAERDPENPLSYGQMVVLGLLLRDGDQTVGELARAEKVQPPSMTRIVNCLADGEYVVRRQHESDGRQVVVSLTEQGRASVMADRERRDAWLRGRLVELDAEERATLAAAVPLLSRLATAD
jgi:DNA-binding MarR family transcriptional regulator